MNIPTTSPHIPVLLNEVITGLNLQPGDIVLDGTIGFGGHSSEMLKKIGPTGKLLGLDQDLAAIKFNQNLFKDANNVYLEHTRFDFFADFLAKHNLPKIDKVLLDLGMSTFQLELAERGFSFLQNQALDMRMNQTNSLTAAQILNTYTADNLKTMFITFGELYRIDRFIDQIITYRQQKPFTEVNDLMFCIKKGFYFKNSRSLFMRTNAQVFQALRIETNQELTALQNFLNTIPNYLNKDGRIAIISFHSLEDRLVKQFGRQHKDKLLPLDNKVIKPTQDEFKINSKAKSAKLRFFVSKNI